MLFHVSSNFFWSSTNHFEAILIYAIISKHVFTSVIGEKRYSILFTDLGIIIRRAVLIDLGLL